MPTQQVTNPAGAYAAGGQTEVYYARDVDQYVASATIAALTIVSFDANGDGEIVPCTGTLPPIGIALTGGAAGAVIDVCTHGIVTGLTSGGTTVNTLCGATGASSRCGAATGLGLNVGQALATVGAATGGLSVYVDPM